MKRVVWSFLSMLMGMVFVLTTAGYAAQEAKIVSAVPLTGPCANDGRMARDGAQLAIDLAGKRPEFKEYSILFVSEDDKSDPKEAAAIANKHAGDAKVYAIVGNYNSSCTLAGAPIYTKAGIVQISPGSSSPKITGFSKCLFRTQATDEEVGENIVAWAKELGYKKAAVIYENSDFGRGLEHIYKELWPKGDGYEIVANESYLPGSTYDFTPILTKVKQAGAEVILLGSLYNEAVLMGKQAKKLRMNIPFIGDTSQHTNALLELGKKNVEGWRVVGAIDENSDVPLTKQFFEEFEKKYKKRPNTFAAQAYDATNIILECLAQNGTDRAKLADYVANVRDFPGVTGNLSFNKGDVSKQLFRFKVENGAFKQVSQ